MISYKEKEFLIQSNLIENVGEEGLEDSIKAWEYIKKLKCINKEDVLKIHQLLMRNLWPEIAGKFRTCNVTVGGKPCPHWKYIEDYSLGITRTLDYINYMDARWGDSTKEGRIIDTHIIFEKLHPFLDGNGRVGRILYNWQRLFLGLGIKIIKYNDRWKYYNWFN